ncbi:hypothetical protein GCM10009836_27680 [Pseudonocardia ailaonensis]|uniref:histidine kinase n=1 Tax=Pseudonocardia ailaonensis TaxID=367279 RepID=A0ABN2N070_9PSEU
MSVSPTDPSSAAGAGFRSSRRVTVGSGRRARSSLLLSGLIGAAGVIAPALVVGVIGGGPAWWVTGIIAAVVLLAGVAALLSPAARRASTSVLVGASEFGGLSVAVCAGLLVLLLLFGRIPLGAEKVLLDPALVAMLVVAVLAGPLGRRFARSTRAALQGIRRSPDELLADFAERAGRGTPVDDLLRQIAETMRQDWRLSRVQIWADLEAGPTLGRTLTVPEPAEPGPAPAPLRTDELATVSRAGVAGPGWLNLWLPHLIEDDGPARRGQLRLAPAVHGGEVLALVVIEREADADPFGEADERALAEVVRRLAIVLRNRALDAALQSTLADLRRTNADLQASRTRLVTTADAERRRIERDLHDGAQQHLVALAVGLRLIRDGMESADPNIELLDELDRGVRDTIQTLRDLAHGIYPPLLRDAGLGDALRAAAKRSPLIVDVQAVGVGRMPEQAEAAVYFCCLEALQNASKHAPGSTVRIILTDEAGELNVVVSDDGPGFDPTGVAGGGGLQNMADRLGAIGGTIELRSAPGEGTTLTGRIPIPRAARAVGSEQQAPVITSAAG